MLLSTQHRTSTVTSVDEEAGDYYVQYYNETKSGVDVLDKLVRTYICKRASVSLHGLCRFFLNMVNAFRNAGAAWASSKRLTCHHHEAG